MIENKLTIRDLELRTYLGWPEQERQHAQAIQLNVDILLPEISRACSTDMLADTICYEQLIQKLHARFLTEKFQLIERLAQEIYTFLQQELPANTKIYLSLTKYPHIPGLQGGVRFSFGDRAACL